MLNVTLLICLFILFVQDVKDNGLYTYRYDTTNGISQSENGFGGYSTGGSVQYISPEGIPISLQYEADANGFRARGAHIPTSPPIPDYILKSIEYNLREAKTKNLNYQ